MSPVVYAWVGEALRRTCLRTAAAGVGRVCVCPLKKGVGSGEQCRHAERNFSTSATIILSSGGLEQYERACPCM